MAVLVVGGGGRGVGKTAVACALMAAMPELQWLAVKVSPHVHGLANGVWEETDRKSEKDTGRYLRAGAGRAFLVDGRVPDIARTICGLRESAMEYDSLMVESNRMDWTSLAAERERGATIAVVDGGTDKTSLQEIAGRADALVARHGVELGDLPGYVAGGLVFRLPHRRPDQLPEKVWMTHELADFVRGRLLV